MHNPISEFVSDEAFSQLRSQRLLDEKQLRDYHIRQLFRQARSKKLSAADAIETVQAEYPYLQFDTIRKIVYRK
jgi:ribonuclease HIII